MAHSTTRKFALEPVKSIRIPVGPKPHWEVEVQETKDAAALQKLEEERRRRAEEEGEDEDEDEDMDGSDEEDGDGKGKGGKGKGKEGVVLGLRSIRDSYMLLQSLRQSRYTILTTFFLKFSSKSKAKNAPEISQPPHTLEYLGKCDLELGPHTFVGTKFFQVNYTPEGKGYSAAGKGAGGQGGTQWNYTAQKGWQGWTYTHQPLPAVTPSIAQQPATSQQPSSSQQPTNASAQPAPALPPGNPGHGLTLTPSLIQQVEAAAAADPELARIRYLAAQNRASAEELHRLGTLIQEINARNTAADHPANPTAPSSGKAKDKAGPAAPAGGQPVAAAAATAVPPQPVTYQSPQGYYIPTRKPDIIFEFRENPTERWLLPCDNSIVERRLLPSSSSGSGGTQRVEAVLSTFLHAIDPAVTAQKEREEEEARKREERRRKKEEKREREKRAAEEAAKKEAEAAEEARKAEEEAKAALEAAKAEEAAKEAAALSKSGKPKPVGKETRSKDKEKKAQEASKQAQAEAAAKTTPAAEESAAAQEVSEKSAEKTEKTAEKPLPKKKTPPKLLPATLHFIDVPDPLWATLLYCSNTADPAQLAHRTTVFAEMLLSSAPRTYPQLRLPNGPLPPDLEEAIADKFASKPFNPKDRTAFALASPTQTRFNALGQPVGPDGLPVPEKPRERKLVSSTWKDGTPRWCQNCGTRETIAWRRGPGGPGTLCQSCGSKFKSKPDLFKLPEEPWTVEKVLQKEIDDKAAKEAAAAEAARKAAELAANPPPPPPPAPKPAEPKSSRSRKSSTKGELEPWSAYSHRELGAQPVASTSAAAAAGAERPVNGTEAAQVPAGQVQDVTQVTPRYRYASVWQDESGASRYSESQTPTTSQPAAKKPRKSKDRTSSSTSESRSYAHPTSGYHYDSRYGWYDYSRGQWLQPHQYAQLHTLGASAPGGTSTPGTPGEAQDPAGVTGTAAQHPYYNDPYYQAYYRNYAQGQLADPRWAAYYASLADPSKAGEAGQGKDPGAGTQPYVPYYGPPTAAAAAAGSETAQQGSAEANAATAGDAVSQQETKNARGGAAESRQDDPMDGSHTAEPVSAEGTGDS